MFYGNILIMLEKTAKRARELFESDLYCAESVLLAITEAKGIESDLIPKIATGFCSGMARTGGLCGAVSGGMMALNLETGRNTSDVPVDDNYAVVQNFLTAFEEKFGSTNCMELTECDLNTEEGQIAFEENNRIVQCLEYVEEATRMAMGLME